MPENTEATTASDRHVLESVVGAVVWNASNHPNPTAVMGRDIGPLRAKIVEAVLAAGFTRPALVPAPYHYLREELAAAVELVADTQFASPGMICRKLRHGENRAEELLEYMQQLGIVGARGPRGQRAVLVKQGHRLSPTIELSAIQNLVEIERRYKAAHPDAQPSDLDKGDTVVSMTHAIAAGRVTGLTHGTVIDSREAGSHVTVRWENTSIAENLASGEVVRIARAERLSR